MPAVESPVRCRADVSVRLGRLGRQGSAPAVAAQLLSLLRSPGSSAAVTVPTGEVEAAAQLLACCAACLAWARYGPLSTACGGDGHPLLQLLAGMQVRNVRWRMSKRSCSALLLHVKLTVSGGSPLLVTPLLFFLWYFQVHLRESVHGRQAKRPIDCMVHPKGRSLL